MWRYFEIETTVGTFSLKLFAISRDKYTMRWLKHDHIWVTAYLYNSETEEKIQFLVYPII